MSRANLSARPSSPANGVDHATGRKARDNCAARADDIVVRFLARTRWVESGARRDEPARPTRGSG